MLPLQAFDHSRVQSGLGSPAVNRLYLSRAGVAVRGMALAGSERQTVRAE